MYYTKKYEYKLVNVNNEYDVFSSIIYTFNFVDLNVNIIFQFMTIKNIEC